MSPSIITGSYDLSLVSLSALIAIFSSYAALGLAAHLSSRGNSTSFTWSAGCALAMGGGIWSMHFIGMLAFSMPMPVQYRIDITLYSLLIAIVVSGLALNFIARSQQISPSRFLISGLLMGTGIASMHYLGMAAMDMAAEIHYDTLLFSASIAIAILASTAALYIAFHLRKSKPGSQILLKLIAAIIMGIAIAGMHYTGMTAATFVQTGIVDHSSMKLIDATYLAIAITIIILLIQGFALIAVLMDNKIQTEQSIRMEKQFTETALDAQQDTFFLFEPGTGKAIRWNRSFREISGYSDDEIEKMPAPSSYYSLEEMKQAGMFMQEVLEQGSGTIELEFICKGGHKIPTEYRVSVIDDETEDHRYMISVGRDISLRKQVDAELRIAATAFDTQESLMITDANGVILRINHAFTESTGYTPEEAIGQTPKLLKSDRHDEAFYAEMWESIHNTGAWQGEIWDRRKDGEVYPKWLSITAVKGENGIVSHYVGSHIDITERKAAEEEIKNLAFYDPLTKLPNRRYLLDRLRLALASCKRSEREGALLFIDLDNFKLLNDTLGHHMGDLLLKHVAQRLISCVRENDTVARLGGDEFVVLLENLSNESAKAAMQVEAVGEKILETLGQSYQLTTQKYHSTPSIGVSMFNATCNLEMDELFMQSDIAMYQAKKAGRNTLRFFDPEMQKSINTRADLEGELHSALENDQFQLHYQIQIDHEGDVLGAEALIRWSHPEHGMVSPAQFIPLAEDTGLIMPIGQWVLDTACAQIKTWQQKVLTQNLILAVNVSAKQFHQADFVAQVQKTIQQHAIKPSLLKLEMTESLLQKDIQDTIAKMNDLKEVGVQFSLDDFGTGYSSLQYLKRLPLDQLKIDQSFVRDIVTDHNDKAIVATIIAMAHSMSLDVIAEGVETEEQQKLLLNIGCTNYQGYFFSKPVPIEQFEAQLIQA